MLSHFPPLHSSASISSSFTSVWFLKTLERCDRPLKIAYPARPAVVRRDLPVIFNIRGIAALARLGKAGETTTDARYDARGIDAQDVRVGGEVLTSEGGVVGSAAGGVGAEVVSVDAHAPVLALFGEGVGEVVGEVGECCRCCWESEEVHA